MKHNKKLNLTALFIVIIMLVTIMIPFKSAVRAEALPAKGFKAISAACGHNLAIMEDGSLWAWGCNDQGQIGDGTTVDKEIPVKIMDNVKAASAGGYDNAFLGDGGGFSLAVKEDGSLWAWGANNYKQLGKNEVWRRYSPTPIRIMDNVKSVAAGSNSCFVIKEDGSLWAWGGNKFGQLGDGTTEDRIEPVKIMTEVKAVFSGFERTYAIKEDGSLWGWGWNGSNDPGNRYYGEGYLGDGTVGEKLKPVKIMDNIKTVSVGDYKCLAIGEDGSLWVWGESDTFHPNPTFNRKSPEKIMDGVIAAAVGWDHNLVVKRDGSLWTWGGNQCGQLGDGTSTHRDENDPVKVADNVKLVAGGFGYSIAVKEDGSLWTWGDNSGGQLGDGTILTQTKPQKVMDNVKMAYAGQGDVESSSDHSLIIKEDGSLWACGSNDRGQLGDGTKIDRSKPVKIMDKVKAAAAGRDYSLVLGKDGTLWACGRYPYIKGTENESTVPTKIMDEVKAVAAGYFHSLALKEDGSLWAWGENYDGEIGDGTTTKIKIEPVKIMDGVKDVAAGDSFSLALKEDGSLWAWGENTFGQLGDGTTDNKNMPVKVMENVKSISCSQVYSLALKEDGSLWACGRLALINKPGSGEEVDSNVPIKLMDNVKAASAGGVHILAIKEDNSLWAWGWNDYGELGDGTTDAKEEPVKIMDNVKSVSAGDFFSLALKEDGSLWAWGKIGNGQLGNGLVTRRRLPEEITDKFKIPETTQDVSVTAYATTSRVLVNGKQISFEAYNISGYNYFKLRDLAMAINGTEKQFEVEWDGAKNAIYLTTNKAYTPVGNELALLSPGSERFKEAKPTTSKVYVNGKEIFFTAYNIDGSNYFKLRDIARVINFGVAWDGLNNTIIIDTSEVYVE